MRSSRPTRLCAVLAGSLVVAGLAAGCTESSEESSDTSTAPATGAPPASTVAAVLLVEQHVHLGLAIAERAYVLSHGTLVLTAPAAELRDSMSLLQASYLGEAIGGVATTDRRSP